MTDAPIAGGEYPRRTSTQSLTGRRQRREVRKALFEREFGADAEVALRLIDLTELAWHDCYGEVTFSDEVLDDLLMLSRGDIHRLIDAAHLALTDWRDLRVAARGW